jgi:polyhydroxyalkanoate synthase subunit PhaC
MAQMPTVSAITKSVCLAHFAMTDKLRRAQGDALGASGLGPRECAFQRISSGPSWHLRAYGGPEAGPVLLMVPAPFKRPYIWDLTPAVSAVRYCLHHGFRVHLIEWRTPSADGADGSAGLDAYGGRAIAACVEAISNQSNGTLPFLLGHSLGGTLATICCAMDPRSVKGLVLLGAPLCFERESSPFRDALVALIPGEFPESEVIAGSLLSQISAVASPNTFVWLRWMDAALSLADPAAMDIHARIERWSLDEVALPAKLINQIFRWLYRENRLCDGTLAVLGRTVGPANMPVPTLAIVNMDDEVAPVSSVAPFLGKMPTGDTRIIEYPGEIGVGLQHLSMLTGRSAYARVWPQIIAWLKARS